jgi:hypothetical protein
MILDPFDRDLIRPLDESEPEQPAGRLAHDAQRN